MVVHIKKKRAPVKKDHYEKTDIHIAYTFAKHIWKEFENFCKAIVLFGSSSRQMPGKKEEQHKDIDILIIVDDVSFYITPEVTEAYRAIIEKNIMKISKRIHVTTLKFTSFWDYVRIGDPIVINMLRDGVALIDTGIFTPMQMLLFHGRIRPTKESTMAYISRAPQAVFNSKWHVMQAAIDLYWAAIDACHAAIMKTGNMPPSPKEMPETIKQILVKPGYVSKECPKIIKELYEFSKKILHRELKEVSGKQYDKLLKKSSFLIAEMKSFIELK